MLSSVVRSARMVPRMASVSAFAVPLASRPFAPIRMLSVPAMGDYEQKIYDILHSHFSPTNLDVRDVSGGCGSMFAITVESSKFKGISMVKQHRLVNEVLKDEIAKWHGIQLRTKAV